MELEVHGRETEGRLGIYDRQVTYVWVGGWVMGGKGDLDKQGGGSFLSGGGGGRFEVPGNSLELKHAQTRPFPLTLYI